MQLAGWAELEHGDSRDAQRLAGAYSTTPSGVITDLISRCSSLATDFPRHARSFRFDPLSAIRPFPRLKDPVTQTHIETLSGFFASNNAKGFG